MKKDCENKNYGEMTLSVEIYKECVIFVFASLAEMAHQAAVLRLCVIKSGEKNAAGMFGCENIPIN